MSKKLSVKVRDEHREYEHGFIELADVPYSQAEQPVEIKVRLVIESGRHYEFKDELEDLISRYAL